uniref:Dimethyladenosine transferase 2, mitochondrial n=1 Tax=Athene cunicularia TaxID=194338 RepID=A0A663N3W7_ATHCN
GASPSPGLPGRSAARRDSVTLKGQRELPPSPPAVTDPRPRSPGKKTALLKSLYFLNFFLFSPLGPGVLTRTLLNEGVRVVALEHNSAFLPNLQSLENSLDGQLKVIYGDFFKLDPLVIGTVKPPVMFSDKLFETIGVEAVPWSAGIYVPVRVFGIIPQIKERIILWRLLFALYECSSIYRYGRIELNIFVSEKEYKVCVRHFIGKEYEVLHRTQNHLYCTANVFVILYTKVQSSFLDYMFLFMLSQTSRTWLPNDHLCLVRLTPRQNLFSGVLKPTNSSTFIFMVKQCLFPFILNIKVMLVKRVEGYLRWSGDVLKWLLDI